MFQVPLDGSEINLYVAFVAGFITFFASCLLPLIPTYLAYLSGLAISNRSNEVSKSDRWQIIKVAVLFVTGFVTTFTILGLALIGLQTFTIGYREIIQRLAGLLFILLGLFMLGLFRLPWFSQDHHLMVNKLFVKHRYVHAVAMGVAFGFGWTPCIGPVLAVILFWASQSATELQGILMLIFYGLGLGLPFIIIAAGFEKILPLIKKSQKFSYYLNITASIIIILVGVLLLFNQFHFASGTILRLLNLSNSAL